MNRINPASQPQSNAARSAAAKSIVAKSVATKSTALQPALAKNGQAEKDGAVQLPDRKNLAVLENVKQLVDTATQSGARMPAKTGRPDIGIGIGNPALPAASTTASKIGDGDVLSTAFDRSGAKLEGFAGSTGKGLFDQIVGQERTATDRAGWAMDKAADNKDNKKDDKKVDDKKTTKKPADDKKADDKKADKTNDKKTDKTDKKDDKKSDKSTNVPGTWKEAKETGKYKNEVDWMLHKALEEDASKPPKDRTKERFNGRTWSSGRRGNPVPDAVAVDTNIDKAAIKQRYQETKAGLVQPVDGNGRNRPDADTLKSASPTSLPRQGWAINPGTGDTGNDNSGSPEDLVDRGQSLKDPPKPDFGGDPTPNGPVPTGPVQGPTQGTNDSED